MPAVLWVVFQSLSETVTLWRSNVETAFSMIKGKVGDAVRSKSDIGPLNEVLCKVLCHNLCVMKQLPPKFEVKRCGVSDHSKDSMAVSSGGYSASNLAQ